MHCTKEMNTLISSRVPDKCHAVYFMLLSDMYAELVNSPYEMYGGSIDTLTTIAERIASVSCWYITGEMINGSPETEYLKNVFLSRGDDIKDDQVVNSHFYHLHNEVLTA